MEETRPVNSAYKFSAFPRSDADAPGKFAALNIERIGSVLCTPNEIRGITCVPQLAVHSLICEKLPPMLTKWLPWINVVLPLSCFTGLFRRENVLALNGTVT